MAATVYIYMEIYNCTLTQRLELFAYLESQFTCGRQHQGKVALRILEQSMQNGQSKGARFARTGFGQANDIFALQCNRYRLLLNFRGRLPFQLLARLAQRVI